jgi:isopenicillin-N epimerase
MGQIVGAASIAAATSAVAAAPPVSALGAGKAADDEGYWRWIREQFLVDPHIAYMNTGTRGPSPRSVVTAQFNAIQAYDRDRLSYARYVANAEGREQLRGRLAAFVGCNTNEIAMTTNTTEGMSIGTAGLDLKPGDEVIYTNHCHSGGAQPINLRAARHGIVPVMVDLSDAAYHPADRPEVIVNAIEAAITTRTKLISFCHVNYTDGCVMPVKEICALARSKGILTLIDGAHPPGMMKMDLHDLGCDMYAGAGHKWLCASMQTGFFFVREELQDQVWPMNYSGPVQGMSMYGEAQPAGSSLDKSRTAAKYELHGSGNYASQASLVAALDFHTTLTIEAIEARVRYMAGRARTGLRNIPGVDLHVSEDPAMNCGLVSFNVRGVDVGDVNDALWDRHHIYIRDVTHAEINWAANRASLHIMVHGADVDKLIGAVEEIAKERGA